MSSLGQAEAEAATHRLTGLGGLASRAEWWWTLCCGLCALCAVWASDGFMHSGRQCAAWGPFLKKIHGQGPKGANNVRTVCGRTKKQGFKGTPCLDPCFLILSRTKLKLYANLKSKIEEAMGYCFSIVKVKSSTGFVILKE